MSTPLPATPTVTSVTATSAQNLTTVAIKFTGDVQFPEALEKMRQDILYLKGVTDVQVSYGEVDVTFDPDQITQKQIDTAIEDHGYHVQE
jgi:copper chaperone CopZ